MGLSIDDVKELIKLLDATGIVDFQLELETGARLTIRKAGAQVPGSGVVGLPAGGGESRMGITSSGETGGTNGAGQSAIVAAGGELRAVGGREAAGRSESRTAAVEPVTGGEDDSSTTKLVEVTAPMVGTFFRAPAPGAEPFVSVGDRIKVGQTLCIIEAMKLMNEIQAEVSGRVTAITAEDGQPVEYGQTLFLVEPD